MADGVLAVHVGVVVFVIFGLVFTLFGGVVGWGWVRNPWFRVFHLSCIAVVTMQAWAGIVCPLTTLEMWLRERGGDAVYSGSFIAHGLDQLLYYDLPAWMFTGLYSGFGLLVLGSWFWVRPRAFGCR